MKVIITGTTGMVGKGVLDECLRNEKITAVLVINRRSLELKHPKLKAIILKDFFQLSSIEHELEGYDACFFCLGITSFRMSEEAYTHTTYDLTMSFANVLAGVNKAMGFIYVSGTGTDSTEKGRIMWARVKGKTENDLFKVGFKSSYSLRPALIQVDKNAPTQTAIYKVLFPILTFLYPLLKLIIPKYMTTTEQVGKAMIELIENGYSKKHIESVDINSLAANG